MTTRHVCGRCGREMTADTAVICQACTGRARGQLTDIPDLLAELETTRRRQARIGDAQTGAPPCTHTGDECGCGTRLPWHEPAARAQADIRATCRSITTAVLDATGGRCTHLTCRDGHGPRCPRHATTARAAAVPWMWLAEHVEDLRRQDWAPHALAALDQVTRTGWRTIDRPETRYYAGPCHHEWQDPERPGEWVLCGRVLWARLDQDTITCAGCGTRWETAARREWLIRSAEDTTATAPVIASALTIMLRRRVSASTLRSWAHRGRLHRTNPDTDPAPTYRVGDVLALLEHPDPDSDQDDDPAPTEDTPCAPTAP